MATKTSKSAKRKKGQSQTGPVFATMPGSVSPPASDFSIYKIPSAESSQQVVEAGRWLAPGEAVTVHGFRLLGGMIYYGAPIAALSGDGVEPSLVNPNLKILDPRRSSFEESMAFHLDYQKFHPVERWVYLRWLANGRNDPDADSPSVYLFFCGLERRLIAPYCETGQRSQSTEPPLLPAERDALREEITRLGLCYPYPSFLRAIGALLGFLDLSGLLSDPENITRTNSEAVAALPRSGTGVPMLLAVVLARIAHSKQPIPAEWAWAWFCHDFESNLRSTVDRCPAEARRLFAIRFAAAVGPKGLMVRPTKTPLSPLYYPNNPGYTQPISAVTSSDPKSREWLRLVNRMPLKVIREVADACMGELDAYSRRVGRAPERRDELSSVALLPDPLFAEHPAVVRFRAWLDALISSDASGVGTAPTTDLLAQWQGSASPTSLSRADTVTLLDAMDRLGFVLEPDLRKGGPALAGPTAAPSAQNLLVAITRRADGAPKMAASAPGSPALFAVGLPLLVRAARAAGIVESSPLRRLALDLPGATQSDETRLAVRLAYLFANVKESARLPKPKELALADLTADDRAQIADVLASAVLLAGAVSPAAVTELIRLFGLLGLPDSEVFSRLHTSASGGTGRRGAATSDEPLTTIRTGKPGAEYAIPKPPPPKAAKKASTGGVTIDLALVKQKEAESAQISTLLADIFADDEPVRVTPTTAATPPTGGLNCLDARHAALLRSLVAKDSWTKAEVAALARAENLLPNAAIEAINEAAFERFDEPILDGEDPIYVSIDLAKEMLA